MQYVAALTAVAGAMAFASSAQAAPSWSDGPVEKSQITNCASIIFGSPTQEDGAWTWTGQFVDPANFPNINEVFYMHVVAGATGNSCSGQYVHFELNPASGVAFAPGNPIFCYAINWNTNPPSAQQEPTWQMANSPTDGACPQTGEGGGLGYGLSFDAYNEAGTAADPWPLPQGRGWEIQIPVTSNRALNGGFGACADCSGFATKLLDGNSSPLLFPRQGLFVNNAVPGGGAAPGGTGGTAGNGNGFKANPTPTAPAKPAAPATTAAAKKCKKGQKLKKGKCRKKKKKK
jgi:hypothetical protein